LMPLCDATMRRIFDQRTLTPAPGAVNKGKRSKLSLGVRQLVSSACSTPSGRALQSVRDAVHRGDERLEKPAVRMVWREPLVPR
jgi:hypothetical protein